MKYLTTPHSLTSIEKLAPFYDGFIIGNDMFGTRLAVSYSVEALNQAIELSIELKKEVFINLNQMYTDLHIEHLKDFLLKLHTDKVTGFIIADLGCMVLLKTLNLANKAIYNPETLLTNTFDFNYLSNDHILGAYVAKEITMQDIETIASHKAYKLFMVGHGHLNMFYSKRKLLHNYADYLESDTVYKDNYELKLIEEKRPDSPYPVLEDTAGTHVFRSKVFSSFSELDNLKQMVDYFVVDTIFKDDAYALAVIKLYQETYDENQAETIKKTYDESWDEGFLHLKTMYKRG